MKLELYRKPGLYYAWKTLIKIHLDYIYERHSINISGATWKRKGLSAVTVNTKHTKEQTLEYMCEMCTKEFFLSDAHFVDVPTAPVKRAISQSTPQDPRSKSSMSHSLHISQLRVPAEKREDSCLNHSMFSSSSCVSSSLIWDLMFQLKSGL